MRSTPRPLLAVTYCAENCLRFPGMEVLPTMAVRTQLLWLGAAGHKGGGAGDEAETIASEAVHFLNMRQARATTLFP